MIRRGFALIVAIALITAACTSASDDTSGQAPERDAPNASILPPANPDDLNPFGDESEEPPPENTDDGRLVVQHRDGQLSTMLPDGSELAPLTDEGTVNRHAAWAPDGSRVAWVTENTSTGEVALALDRFDRSDFRSLPIDTEPFYLYWDPSSSRIAHLSGTSAGVDLSVAEPFDEDGPTNRRLDRGEPFFLSWGPDGDELLVHASGFRFDRIDLGDATVIIDEFPASFGAPAWLADNTLVYADVEDDEQFLISTGARGEGRRPLVRFDGTLRFAVNNDGNRVVMQSLPLNDDDSVITASTSPEDSVEVGLAAAQTTPTPTPGFDDSLDQIDPIEPFIPYVMGTFGGEPVPLSSLPALALFPSPDGQATAWFETAPGGRGAIQLKVDSPTSLYTSPAFVPSETLLDDYVPFFDQYEQSHDFWSPSSNLFVFAGRQFGDDEDGIWVFDRSTGDITRIADGVVASFTRTPDAAGAASSL